GSEGGYLRRGRLLRGRPHVRPRAGPRSARGSRGGRQERGRGDDPSRRVRRAAGMTRKKALAIAGVVAVLGFQVVLVVLAIVTKQPGLIIFCFIVLVIAWFAIKPNRPR